jgi:hypothetical protein
MVATSFLPRCGSRLAGRAPGRGHKLSFSAWTLSGQSVKQSGFCCATFKAFKQWTPYFVMPLADMRASESWNRIASHPSVPDKLTPLSFDASAPAQQAPPARPACC